MVLFTMELCITHNDVNAVVFGDTNPIIMTRGKRIILLMYEKGETVAHITPNYIESIFKPFNSK